MALGPSVFQISKERAVFLVTRRSLHSPVVSWLLCKIVKLAGQPDSSFVLSGPAGRLFLPRSIDGNRTLDRFRFNLILSYNKKTRSMKHGTNMSI